MQTLYLDVYFLINFTVDILALYFAVVISHVPTSKIRMLFSGFIASIYAICAIFIESGILKIVTAIISAILICKLCTFRVSTYRRIKLFFCFLLFETVIGGLVYYIFNLFDDYIVEYFELSPSKAENRKYLIVALGVLLSVGVFKLFISLFSGNTKNDSVTVEVVLGGKTIKTDAFVDSGNLAKDPIDLTPVMFIKAELLEKLIPGVKKIEGYDSLPDEYKSKIRLIPINSENNSILYIGIKPDRVSVIMSGRKEDIRIIIAMDKECGTYGGYNALIPSCVIHDIM